MRNKIHSYVFFGLQYTHNVLVGNKWQENIEYKLRGLLLEAIDFPAGCACSKDVCVQFDVECVSEASSGVRPFVSRATQRRRLDGQEDAALRRETPVQRSTLALLGEQCVGVNSVSVCCTCLCTNACVSMCACPRGLGGVTHVTIWIPVDGCFQDWSLWTEEEEGRERMMRLRGGWLMGSSRDGAAC